MCSRRRPPVHHDGGRRKATPDPIPDGGKSAVPRAQSAGCDLRTEMSRKSGRGPLVGLPALQVLPTPRSGPIRALSWSHETATTRSRGMVGRPERSEDWIRDRLQCLEAR